MYRDGVQLHALEIPRYEINRSGRRFRLRPLQKKFQWEWMVRQVFRVVETFVQEAISRILTNCSTFSMMG